MMAALSVDSDQDSETPPEVLAVTASFAGAYGAVLVDPLDDPPIASASVDSTDAVDDG